MADFRITCLQRHPEHGYWTAHVTAGGRTLHVDRRSGSWLSTPRGDEPRRFVLTPVAIALQDRVRVLEKREREAVKARAAAAKTGSQQSLELTA